MTIPVSVQQRIRLLDQQGTPWRAIARDLNVSRDTVRKYALMEDCSPKPKPSTTRPRKLDGFTPVIDEWLQADRFMPRKQRHTAKRVYDRLVTEKGFTGSYSAVQRYVKQWRQEHRPACDGFMELEWRPGVMQVDFGEAVVVLAGVKTKVHCLVASFPYSNKRYVVALPGENAQCVCEGLVEIFEHIGLVPMVLVMDNATGPRTGPLGTRSRSSGSSSCSWSITGSRPGSAIPGAVGRKAAWRTRSGSCAATSWFPLLNVESYAQLSKHLLSRCDELGNDKHYRADESVNDLFEEKPGGHAAIAARALRRGRLAGTARRQGRCHTGRFVSLPRRPGVAGRYWWDCARSTWRSVPATAARWPRCPGLMASRPVRCVARRRCCRHWRASHARGANHPCAVIFPRAENPDRRAGLRPAQGHVPLVGARGCRLRFRRGLQSRGTHHRPGQTDRRGSPEHHGQTDSVRRGAGRCSRARPERVRRLHENRRWRYAQGAGRREGR